MFPAMFSTTILIIVSLILLFILLLPRWRVKKYPPGPYPWPLIGNQPLLKHLTREFGAQHLAFTELSKRYGSNVIALRLGNTDMFVVSGNKTIQKVVTSEEYDGRPWNEFIRLRNMGKKSGITMNDGVEWKELRGWMVRTFRSVGFGKTEMSNLIKDELLEVLGELKNGGIRSIKPVIGPAVINVLWTLATGKRFCEGSRLNCFVDLMDRRSHMFDMVGGLLSRFPWIRYIAPEFSGYNILVTLNNELKKFLMDAIEAHKEKYIPGSESDLIDMFLRERLIQNDLQDIYTDDQLLMVLVDLFLAGCTNTSTTLDFLFLSMIVHQDVQEKVHKEIDSVISSDRLPDIRDKRQLPYTEAVLTEAQRLWVTFPIIGPRRVLRDTKLDDYDIPEDSSILINMYSINLDPTLYPEPEKFKPERFIKNGVYEADENLILFGKGRRRCPGEVLAKTALFLLFVGVMQKYKLLPVPGKEPHSVEVVPGLTLSPKPYDILIVPR